MFFWWLFLKICCYIRQVTVRETLAWMELHVMRCEMVMNAFAPQGLKEQTVKVCGVFFNTCWYIYDVKNILCTIFIIFSFRRLSKKPLNLLLPDVIHLTGHSKRTSPQKWLLSDPPPLCHHLPPICLTPSPMSPGK